MSRRVFLLAMPALSGLAGAVLVAQPAPPPSSPHIVAASVSGAALPAFPGAEGYGAMSAGGRGGKIVAITTLADSGRGSLRACIGMSGPRVCVFRVNGLIRFVGRPPVITQPFLTIAGQTAPGGGITLAHSGGQDGVTPLLMKNTHDIVIRDIRVRPDRRGAVPGGNDAITFENSRNVILDHVSGSWALDENVNGQGDNDNVTISWSVFAEGTPKHDKCALLGSDPTRPQRMSFIHNLCAHNGDRNPDMNFTPGSCIDVVNNVFYDAGLQFAEVWESYGGTSVNIVANTFRAGPSTKPNAVGLDRQTIGSRGPARVYAEGNAFDGQFIRQAPSLSNILVSTPVCPLSIKPMSAQDAYRSVLLGAGAMPRDPVDQRIVAEVRDRSGRIRTEPGTIPPSSPAQAPTDGDGDGMPDVWEQAHGTSLKVSDPWQDADGDGLPNLDEYLDEAHRRLATQAPLSLAQREKPFAAKPQRCSIAAMISAITRSPPVWLKWLSSL